MNSISEKESLILSGCEMSMKQLLCAKKHGFAVALALVAVMILLAMGVALLSLGVNGRIYSTRNVQNIQARCAADSGAVKALYELNASLKTKRDEIAAAMKQTESTSSASIPGVICEELPHCEAAFSYSYTSAQKSVYSTLNMQGLTIESIGTCGSATAKVYVFTGLKGLFDSAILVQDRISLMPNTLVAAYNSADPTDTDFKLQIGTTSTQADRIPLGPGTVVDGDVFVGVGGDPKTVLGAGGTITGRKYALDEDLDLPVINPPSLANWGMALSATGQTVTLGPGQSGTYTAVTLSQGGGNQGILEIQGGDVVLHIAGNMDLGNGCEVIVRPGSSLVIYVDGNISADNSVGFNNQAGNVRDLQLLATGTGQVFSLKAKSSIFGTVYAPNVDITLYPSSEMRGAIVGRNVTFKSGSTFYYDEALRDNVSVYDEGVRFVVKRWREE